MAFSLVSGSIQVTNGFSCDLNGDGKTDASDLRLLARHVAGMEVFDNTCYADVNQDGIVSAADLTALAKLLNN